MLLLIFVGTFAALALSAVAAWLHLNGRRRVRDLLLRRDSSQQKATEVRKPSLADRWEWASRQAGLEWSARHYVLVVCGCVLAGVVLLMAGAQVAGLLAVAAGLIGPWLTVRYLRRLRISQFSEQLPAALTLAANTMKSGATMHQAVKAVAKGMPEPIRGEFARIEQALHLHVPLGAALEQAGQRIGAQEFSAVVVACKVAGQAGADLDGILESIAKEIVEERQFRDEMRSASSEPRTTARLVTAFPLVMGAFFLWNDPSYFDIFVTTFGGKVILILLIGIMAAGWVVISRMADPRYW